LLNVTRGIISRSIGHKEPQGSYTKWPQSDHNWWTAVDAHYVTCRVGYLESNPRVGNTSDSKTAINRLSYDDMTDGIKCNAYI